MSVATVNNVGVYAVDVAARALVNTTDVKMAFEDGVKIPGPLTPEIALPEVEENISVTEDDKVAHVIAAAGSAVLKTSAIPGETGKAAAEVGDDPQVSLVYSWKERINGVEQEISGEEVAACPVQVSALPLAQIPQDGNYEDAIANQSKISVVQVGSNVVIYVDGDLVSYESTNPEQGSHQWIALDVDTGLESVVGATWGGSYTLTQADEDEALGLGLGLGHLIFWAKAENFLAEAGSIQVNDTTVAIAASHSLPENVSYSFNADHSQLTITGLSAGALDRTYVAEVTATRNKVSTTGKSGDYRITNKPEAPVIKIRTYDGRNFILTERNYKSEAPLNVIDVTLSRSNVLSFSVEPPALSDNLRYVWMRVRADEEISSDWSGSAVKLQADLDDAIAGLSEIVGNPEGPADYTVSGETIEEAVRYITSLPAIGEGEDGDNGPRYEVPAGATGIYYCVVINELNNNINANITPFYRVV
jgi:hypothetical protein